MHKPDPKLKPTEQCKRSVVAIAREDVDTWLHGTYDEAAVMVRLRIGISNDLSRKPGHHSLVTPVHWKRGKSGLHIASDVTLSDW